MPEAIADPAPPVERMVTRNVAVKGIVVPEAAAVHVAVAMVVSAVVPAEPMRSVKVDRFATVEVQVPETVIRYVVPAWK